MYRIPIALLCLFGFNMPAYAAEKDTPSFLLEVEPILTKVGCNQGACHGKGAGQNGFRLSLRGYAPADDHYWITREFGGRRLDKTIPEESLLIRKATARTPHEGGRVINPQSREYELLLGWIRAGTPGPDPEEPKLTRLELKPASRVLKPGERVQLTAVGEFTDGSQRDVTWLTKFEANDPAQLQVSANGEVVALRNGASAVRAMYLSEVAVAEFRVPFDNPIDRQQFPKPNNAIDKHVFQLLEDLRIPPSAVCRDEEFIRRVYLDACGILPTPEEVRAFVADKSADKRAKLIDAVLDKPEFVDYWTLQYADLLQNRKERDHDVRGVKGVRQFHAWLHEQVSNNRPWDQLAHEVLTAKGSQQDQPAVGYYVVTVGEKREGEKSEAPESVAQAFLGTRIGCARCHNHPLERYTQDDFYQFAAFFSRVKLNRNNPIQNGPSSLEVSKSNRDQNDKPVGVVQPRTGQFLPPQPLDRSQMSISPGDDPRQSLAEWITDPANPYFTGAMVNRIWKHYLGTGLVEPVDDLRMTNPPTNGELWKGLNSHFIKHRFDTKELMRLILNSTTYQLSSETRPENAAESRFYSHYYARRLPAEVLLDAISQATGVPEQFAGYPLGLRAVQIPDPGANSYFLRTFGRSERVTACACEREGDVSLPQVLHLIGGQVTQKIQQPQSWLNARLKEEPDNDTLLSEAFLRTLGREPGEAEKKTVHELLAEPEANRDEVFRDLYWALINSKEFLFNR